MDEERRSLLAFLKGQLRGVIDIQTDLIFIRLEKKEDSKQEKHTANYLILA